MAVSKSLLYFVLAGFCKIGGGYLVWLCEGKSVGLAVLGAVVLVLYGIIPTLQPLTLVESMRCMAGSSSFFRFCGAGRLTECRQV